MLILTWGDNFLSFSNKKSVISLNPNGPQLRGTEVSFFHLALLVTEVNFRHFRCREVELTTLFKMLHICTLFIARPLVSNFLHSSRKWGTRCDVS